MKKLLFAALVASAFVPPPASAGTFGLIPNYHYKHYCRCWKGVQQDNAFSCAPVASIGKVSPELAPGAEYGFASEGVVEGGIVEGGCADGSCRGGHFAGKIHRHLFFNKQVVEE